ncbi:YdeI/OmpD-associated family protein [bacterium]|nr:YdeI/OmpD-associated family protein [bacterium]
MKFHFDAPVLRTESGMINHFLPVPDEVAVAFKEAGVRRVVAILNGKSYRRALTGDGAGGSRLIVGQPLLKEIGARLDDMVTVILEPDPDPDAVELPEEFIEVLEQDEEAASRFDGMTAGMQRSLALYISTAKRSDTRIRRSLEIARKLRTNTLHGDRKD